MKDVGTEGVYQHGRKVSSNFKRYGRVFKYFSDEKIAGSVIKEYGEWYGYLHRDGTVAQPAKGNLFKGPFHVPRMMTKGYMLCEEIMSEIKKEIR